jgi:predicted ATPase
MLQSVDLQLFKCFRRLRLPLAPLTLLTGTNASGKSTVLQALVLLQQTMLDHEWAGRLHLNGSQLTLGRVRDVVDKVNGRREFSLSLQDARTEITWNFSSAGDRDAMSAAVGSIIIQGRRYDEPGRLRHLVPEPDGAAAELVGRLLRQTYLTAERVGPRDYYELQDSSLPQLVGARGENSVGLLFQRRDEMVQEPLLVANTDPRLFHQVEARMRQFFPGTRLQLKQVQETNLVSLGLKTSDATDFHRPVHVGFGLTQVLPIVVAALAARPGDIVLLENPEVHLHPIGQAEMGRFLAEVAATGVQVLAESHSDHVLNGIRRAVKGGRLEASQVLLHFFQSRDSAPSQVITPIIDSRGVIDHWPAGFFDQYDKDLNYFADWGE